MERKTARYLALPELRQDPIRLVRMVNQMASYTPFPMFLMACVVYSPKVPT